MQSSADAIAAMIKEGLVHLLGSAGGYPVLGPITTADVAALLSIAALALLAHGLSAALLRGRPKRMGPNGTGRSVRQQVIEALAAPLHAVIWACAIYVAVDTITLASSARIPAPQGPWRLWGALFGLALMAAAFWFLFRLTYVLEARVARWAGRTRSKLDDLLVPVLGRGLRVVIPVAGVMLATPMLNLSPKFAAMADTATSMLLISAVSTVLIEVVGAGERAILAGYDLNAVDNLRARKAFTQVHIIARVAYVTIGVFAIASVLMLFPSVRHVGASLLASAGIAGIVAGIAAQKSIANLIAGFQIALAQPIRQDDVVIVDGEWGRIEEITLTHVIVHLWDDRRLVVPLSYFIEKPFQNWTRTSAKLLGSVLVWVDYSFPVEEGRRALKAIIEGSAQWDRRYWSLQVTDFSERAMQLRVLATSSDSSSSWDLRCEIREKFIEFIQRNHPQNLPTLRARTDRLGAAPPPA